MAIGIKGAARTERLGTALSGALSILAVALLLPVAARAAPPDAPTGTTTTQRLLADNDFALLAGTSTNVTRHLYNNPTVWWGQDEMWATNPQFPVVYGETHVYLIAMGDNEVDDFGGRINGVDITDIAAAARAGRAARDPGGLGSVRFSVAAGERIVIRLGLDAEGRRLLERRGSVAVRPVIRAEGGMRVPTLPVVRFMEITDGAFGARAVQAAAAQDREAMLRIVRAASGQRLHWQDAIRRLRTEVLPAQGAALRAALDLPEGTPAQRRVRRLLIGSAQHQLAATRGYIRWFAHDDRDAQQRAIANDRLARTTLDRALRQARAVDR